ncbi:hypothetical protein O181_065461 [Austropuccinia psidii MF-1]|uniref:Uncharacterized protein n=1 Tax=Austropuccinia psidii MF-1 TaxID=1389203 RepID=A0A9Q3I187_9BASI|nr:hypothetical protein [Austropuccinia psidii MF-1]
MESCPLLEKKLTSLDTQPCPDITAIVLPYIEFEDIFEKENSPLQTVSPDPWKELPGLNLKKYEFLELLTWDGVEGNLENQYWNEIFHMDEHLRKSLLWRTWECQYWFNLQDFQIQNGKISKISGSHIVKTAKWNYHWEETLIPEIFSIRGGAIKWNTEDWDFFCQEHLFQALKRETWRGGKFIKPELVKEVFA